MDTDEIKTRLRDLNTKAYYLLIALSFLYYHNSTNPGLSLKLALTFTAISAVAPLQDLFPSSRGLNAIRWTKFALMWAALICTLLWLCSPRPAEAMPRSNERTAAGEKREQPNTQTAAPPQLQQRVSELEKQMAGAQEQAAKAELEKDYITRVQKQYESYYEKAFNTQVTIVSILALFISVVLAIAAKFGFDTFDRRIESALKETAAQLRTEFRQELRTELDALKASNDGRFKALEDGLTERISQQEHDLRLRSKFQYHLAQGLAVSADDRFADARRQYRAALRTYKLGRDRKVLTKRSAAIAAHNIFVQYLNENEEDFVENAKKELNDELYSDLGDELALAAADLPVLAPLLKQRRWAKPVPPPADATP